MTKKQQEQWGFFAEILGNYGMFNSVNAAHLEMLSVNMAEWRDVLKKLTKEGWVMRSVKGGSMQNPLVGIKNNLEIQIRADLDRLGLSSQGLAKLGSLAARAKKKEGIEEFMD